ncbi:PTS sugar transporter subunit IIC [bacterium]|nr:PTS sugar transporter subunit IIC [bacterium]MBU1983154.1 PTS sugar transporter subunit IIC [bacterium]
MWQAVWVGLAGAVVYLDTTAVAQLMICQPLIACPLWGFVIGRPEVGLFFGIGFQLLWLGSLPVGAARFPEGNLGALIATAIAAGFPAVHAGLPDGAALAGATFLGILTAYVGSEVTPLIRKEIASHVEKFVAAAQAGEVCRFRRLFFGAVGIHAGAGFVMASVAYLFGSWGLRLGLDLLELPNLDIAPALLGAGAAVIAGRLVSRRNLSYFAVPAIVVLLVGLLWV